MNNICKFFWLWIQVWILFVRIIHEYIQIFKYLLHSNSKPQTIHHKQWQGLNYFRKEVLKFEGAGACVASFQKILDLEDLVQRRNYFRKSFAKQSVRNVSLHFELNDKMHTMITRYTNEYTIYQCHTERLRISALPDLQRMLNSPQSVTLVFSCKWWILRSIL